MFHTGFTGVSNPSPNESVKESYVVFNICSAAAVRFTLFRCALEHEMRLYQHFFGFVNST